MMTLFSPYFEVQATFKHSLIVQNIVLLYLYLQGYMYILMMGVLSLFITNNEMHCAKIVKML